MNWQSYAQQCGKVKTFARKHKLKEFWEYQVRGNEVRFADEDFALLFRLTL